MINPQSSIPYLPARVEGLAEIAMNLWWSWSREARALFHSIDEALWHRTRHNPLELLVATILSAQCTDVRVNMVTPALFRKYRTAADYARAPAGEDVEQHAERGGHLGCGAASKLPAPPVQRAAVHSQQRRRLPRPQPPLLIDPPRRRSP